MDKFTSRDLRFMMWLENGKVMVKFTTRDLRFWKMPNKDYLNYQIPKELASASHRKNQREMN